jgi:2-methylcitrate dehydratase PrpD
MSSETWRLANYLSTVSSSPLPREVAERTRLHLLDALAAMVSGSTLEAGRRALAFVQAEGASEDASVIGGGMTATAADAAFANGLSAHADETDDSHPSGFHPGCAVVAASLAVAEREHASGAALLRAIAAGYDVGARGVLAAIPPPSRQSGYSVSTHAIGATFGAGAAAASLLSLSAQQLCWVLSYTAQQAWGARSYLRDAHHVEKAFVYGGRPARGGVIAASMVQRGFDAVDDIFDGEFNYFDAVGYEPDRAALTDGLGERWEIMRTNIKRYPVGSPILGVVEGLNRLLHEQPIDPARVTRVVISMPRLSAQVVNERDMPNVNAQHIAALMLVDGGLSLAASHDHARMQDPRVMELRRHIELAPAAAVETRVDVHFTDGGLRSERVPTARSEPDVESVRQKALELIGPTLGDDLAAQLVDHIMRVDELEDVRQLRPLLLHTSAVLA